MPGIADMFRSVMTVAQPTAPGAPTPAGGAGAPTASPDARGMSLAQPNAGTTPTGSTELNLQSPELNPDGTPKAKGSPLDDFSDLFTIDPKKTPAKDPLSEPLLKLDPKTLAEQVNKMDFVGQISPEQFQALQQDPTKLSAFMNGSMRKLFMMQFQAVAGVLENAFKSNNERFSSTLDGRFRKHLINSATSDNPVLKHKAVQPVLASIRDLIATQHPDMNPADVAARAEEYFLTTHKALGSLETDNDELETNKNAAGGGAMQDWSKYANT